MRRQLAGYGDGIIPIVYNQDCSATRRHGVNSGAPARRAEFFD